MLYFLAILLPPLAVLFCGKPVQAILNLILWLLGIVPGVIHALFVVNSHLADKRNRKLMECIRHADKDK
ncbi:YqaE/Pmp3 family membrane protein [Endozoicomonadaceae bacterium StTr2]